MKYYFNKAQTDLISQALEYYKNYIYNYPNEENKETKIKACEELSNYLKTK